MPDPAALPLARQPARRAAAWAALVLAVLLGHVWVLLALLPARDRAPAVTSRSAPIPARLVALLPPLAPPAPPTLAMAPQRPSAHQRTVKAAKSAALPDVPALLPAAPAALPPDAASSERGVPVYATRLPASATLLYRLQRGELVGSGQLVWQRRDEDYELSLEGELRDKQVLGSISRGGIDAHGMAPLRLADRRRLRELRAANFQRDAQRITFSGPQVEYPLLPGAQDRLSWMIQLPAIVEADPTLVARGARISLFVVGTRGDAEAWDFEVQGHETLALPAGTVAQALHLRRDPSRPYDTRIEVWLDPARQHLPVRVRFTTVPDGTPTELQLLRIAAGAS